ncbi:MAG: MurR/RpiR family transcriptional regulator [Epulopiscium sp.]|nr:MurR/RpiR family transcriptional regulator [Candidatus Epulonipiscium sp.]
MDDYTLKIKEIYDELNPTEIKIADYLLTNIDDVFNLSIQELAEKTGASQAAWVRFCKLLGYSGLKEFKKTYIMSGLNKVKNENNDEEQLYTDIKGYTSVESIVENVSLLNAKAITDTQKILDIKSVEQAVRAISQAKKILFLGAGASGLVAQDAAYKFTRIGKYSIAASDFHIQLTHTSLLQKEDVVVIISYSGRTKEMIECLDIAKEIGCPVISITKYGKNEIGSKADIPLFISAPEIEKRSGAMGSRIAQLAVVDILFTGVANREYESIEAILKRTSEYTAEHKI